MSTSTLDTAAQRKARGAFFTPPALCAFVASWALRAGSASCLEPSAGDAEFLLAAGARFRELGVEPADGALVGMELHAATAVEARERLRAAGLVADVQVGDFLREPPQPRFDAVVGNPPYVRFQDFAGGARVDGRRAAARAGVDLTALASSWAAFTVHAAGFLAPGGRLGLVLPAELLSTNYAAPVREFLLGRFERVRLVTFDRLLFAGVLTEVVLLLAEGDRLTGRASLEVQRVVDVAGLAAMPDQPAEGWLPPAGPGKWTPALLPPDAIDAYLAARARMGVLGDWGRLALGIVTGNNSWFALSPDRALACGLGPEDLRPLSPPGSRHLRALTLSTEQLTELGSAGSATWLFRPAGRPGPAAARYLAAGERAGVQDAYKCRVRDPWWRVPLQQPADLLLTYMSAGTAQLCTNEAGVLHLNSAHGLHVAPADRDLARELLPLAALNSVTALGAELVGRSYGGGILKLEPREARALPVPSARLVRAVAPALRQVRRPVRDALLAGRLDLALDAVDGVFADAIGPSVLIKAGAARDLLADRRATRGAS